MFIGQDTDTDTGSGTFRTWSISSLTVTINVALDGKFMIASILANDKGRHTSSCISIADIYHTALRLMLSVRICYTNETCQLSHSCLYILNH